MPRNAGWPAGPVGSTPPRRRRGSRRDGRQRACFARRSVGLTKSTAKPAAALAPSDPREGLNHLHCPDAGGKLGLSHREWSEATFALGNCAGTATCFAASARSFVRAGWSANRFWSQGSPASYSRLCLGRLKSLVSTPETVQDRENSALPKKRETRHALTLDHLTDCGVRSRRAGIRPTARSEHSAANREDCDCIHWELRQTRCRGDCWTLHERRCAGHRPIGSKC
jgi:hypothetical protein